MRTRTNNVEVNSNGEDVWVAIDGKEKLRISIETYDNLLDSLNRLNPQLANFF